MKIGIMLKNEPVHCTTADEVRALARKVYERRFTVRRPVLPLLIAKKPNQVREVSTDAACKSIVATFWKPTAREILRQVALKHQITVNDLKGYSRVKFISRARQEAMYRIRCEVKLSLPHIGKILGGKDHTSVLNAVRVHAARNNLAL